MSAPSETSADWSESERAHGANAVLADLRWAACGPALWGTLPPLYSQWVASSGALWAALAADPTALLKDLAAHKRTPIGRYFERLIGFWMKRQADVHNLHENLAIQGHKGTLGELDLVFQSQQNAYHWELALKYYLGTGDRTQACNWHGPRGRDRLDLKLEKLVSRQLKLPSTDEGQALLRTLGIEAITSHELIKGAFFHPFEDWQSGRHTIPDQANRLHDRGWWLTLAESSGLHRLPVAAWQVLAKPSWLSPAAPQAPLAPAELAPWLHQNVGESSATMLAALSADGHQLHRGFVVPDTWPPLG